MKKYLPIGSVVLLKESKKRIMIVGLKQKQVDSDKVWDYSACLYPEGILDPDRLYLFDAEQIERLYFIGMQDGECLAFLNKVNHLDDEEAVEKEAGEENYEDFENNEDFDDEFSDEK